ncbi:RidA family protein [Acidomonas methanolica]|uniref:RidA family protein n=1 Tax=Acidomonas methanolica TaxID=437 RepID=UPI00211A60CD|nr:RidA family protein [Acidomonas methanolica]MCQ9155760.1 RidA family protein [Acidomonas methanolica]
MSRIIRTEPGPILSKVVEYHGFIYTMGVVARDLDADFKTQTADVLAQLDALLEQHGTDNTRLLQAQIWVKDINDRAALNELWTAWLPEGHAPARACVQAVLADPRVLVEIMVVATR